MIETDAPYLLPRDLRPRPKNGRNEPAYLPHIAQTIAELTDQPYQYIAVKTTNNAKHFFHIRHNSGHDV
jgi:TatD DNase family protein